MGTSIAWLPAGGGFRIWGLQGQSRRDTEAAVGFLCSFTVLCAAALPAWALGVVASGQTSSVASRATVYLMTVPMIAVFLIRVLWRKPS
jgi:hypothetical protein